MSDPNQLHDPHGRPGYDPNQPRVPAGQSTGGQWTDTDGPNLDGAPQRKIVRDTSGQEAWNFYYNMYRPDGSLAEQVVFNRDRSRIVSEFNEPGDAGDWRERHTVITPDGNKFTFEDHGDNQIAYEGGNGQPSETVSTEQGSEERPIVQKAFLPAVAAPAIIGVGEGIGIAAAGLALLTWLSRRNSRKGTYALSFAPDVLERGVPAELRRVQLAPLSEEELNDVCPRHKDVQAFTNEAAAAARLEPRDWKPSAFGTEVHKRVAHMVNSGGLDEAPSEPPSPNKPNNHNFRAEISALKIEAALRADAVHEADAWLSAEPPVKPETGAPAIRLPRYGERDTVRVDVFENQPEKRTVCLYDIKTGEKLLYFPRMKEIARAVLTHYPNALRVIVAEVRPR